MIQDDWLNILRKNRVIAVIRASKMEQAWQMANAVAAGGIRIIEITWNTHQAEKLITLLRSKLPNCTITIISATTKISIIDHFPTKCIIRKYLIAVLAKWVFFK